MAWQIEVGHALDRILSRGKQTNLKEKKGRKKSKHEKKEGGPSP